LSIATYSSELEEGRIGSILGHKPSSIKKF
jgi:hypothetical protein